MRDVGGKLDQGGSLFRARDVLTYRIIHPHSLENNDDDTPLSLQRRILFGTGLFGVIVFGWGDLVKRKHDIEHPKTLSVDGSTAYRLPNRPLR